MRTSNTPVPSETSVAPETSVTSEIFVDRPSLIASDVDGTLMSSEGRITPRTREAIGMVMDRGTPFILATGRPPRWIAPVVDELGHAPLAVCANGAVLYDSGSGRVVRVVNVDQATLTWLTDLATHLLDGVGLAAERISEGTPSKDDLLHFVSAPGYQHAWERSDHTETSLEDLIERPASKLLVRCPTMSSSDMVAILAPHIDGRVDMTYSTENGLLEISATGVNKATGLLMAAEYMNVSPASILAFGDMPNDVPMLTMARHGVAMGNAHPDARDAADEITAANDDDGVGRVLERLT